MNEKIYSVTNYPCRGSFAALCLLQPFCLSIQWELCLVQPFCLSIQWEICLVQPFCLSIQCELWSVLSSHSSVHPVGPLFCLVQTFYPSSGNFTLSCPALLSNQWEFCSVLSCPTLQSIHPVGTYLSYFTPKCNASTNSYLLVLSALRSKYVRIQRQVQTRG